MNDTSSSTLGSTRIKGFDGLRAIAFLLVFLSHKIGTREADNFGAVGVVLFFVLSGFLITRILANMRSDIESGQSTPTESLTRFYIRRGARIFPAYYLLLLVITAIWLFAPIEYFWLRQKLAYYFYWTNILIANDGWVGDFGHFWTLAVEQQFYIAFAPLILFFGRRHTLPICVATVLVGALTIFTMQASGASSLAIGMNSFVNFAVLGIGGIVGLIADRPAPRWLVTGSAQLAVLSLLILLAFAIPATEETWNSYGYFVAAIAGILLLQVAQGQSTWTTKVLDGWSLKELGLISYGAYLLHHFVHFSMLEHFLARFGIAVSAPWALASLAELGVTIALAALSWRCVERPIMKRAARFSAQLPPRQRSELKAT
jgi:peptidoglycan/LPS O-acetylase OafA/YrhL